MVDTSGNGRPNHKVKGVSGFAVIKAKNPQGEKFTYALRFRKAGTAWQYASSGVMQGKVKGETIRLIDLNNNGVWNEFGTDGIIVGKGSSASLLSKAVNLDGDVYNLEVSADGSSVKVTPYEGATGTLNVRDGFRAHGQLVAAVVSNESGNYSFELASAKRGMKVPVGKYVITSGYAKRGGSSVLMRTGRMQPIEVTADQDANLEWGAELKAEFTYSRNGEKVSIEPHSLKYYGKSGVEFYQWNPDAKSPKFVVKDKKTGKEIASGRFGGC